MAPHHIKQSSCWHVACKFKRQAWGLAAASQVFFSLEFKTSTLCFGLLHGLNRFRSFCNWKGPKDVFRLSRLRHGCCDRYHYSSFLFSPLLFPSRVAVQPSNSLRPLLSRHLNSCPLSLHPQISSLLFLQSSCDTCRFQPPTSALLYIHRPSLHGQTTSVWPVWLHHWHLLHAPSPWCPHSWSCPSWSLPHFYLRDPQLWLFLRMTAPKPDQHQIKVLSTSPLLLTRAAIIVRGIWKSVVYRSFPLTLPQQVCHSLANALKKNIYSCTFIAQPLLVWLIAMGCVLNRNAAVPLPSGESENNC